MPEVTLLKVITPGEFWIRLKVDDNGIATLQKVSELEQRLNDLALSVPGRLARPAAGQNVLVKSKEDRQWYRGCITSVLHSSTTSDSALIRVFYIDHGDTITVGSECLRTAPSIFEELPWQAQRCTLHNVKPLSLTFTSDMRQVPQSSPGWDESALSFFCKSTQGKRVSIDIIEADESGVLSVNLYAGKIFLNELLVAEDYALFADQVTTAEPQHVAPLPQQPHHNDRRDTGLSASSNADRSSAHSSPVKFGPPEARSWQTRGDSSRSNTPSTPPSSRWSERILRRLARCLQDIWVDIAYEMEWRSPQVDSTRSKTGGNNVDACFIVLQHWSSANSSSASLLSLLRDAGFQNQADEVEDIVGSSPIKSAGCKVAVQPISSISTSSTPRPESSQRSNVLRSSTAPRGSPFPEATSRSQKCEAQEGRDIRKVMGPVPEPKPDLRTTPPAKPGKGRGAALASAISSKTTTPGRSANSPPKLSRPDAQLERYRAVTAPKLVATRGQTSDIGSGYDDHSPLKGSSGKSSDPSDHSPESARRNHNAFNRRRLRFDLHAIRVDMHGMDTHGDEIAIHAQEKKRKERQVQGGGGFVLVRGGPSVPEPVRDITGVQSFPQNLVDRCERCDLKSARTVQSYCWPGIMRGRDLVCISPRNSGKTLSHCVPLLAKILHPIFLTSMPKGIGPFVIVLLPTWEKVISAHALYDNLGHVRQSQCRSFAVHGGGAEEEQVVKMVNGCEVIVATPPSLLRLLRKRQTSLKRLRHLVFDDCDDLAENFTDEIMELMDMLAQSLASNTGRSPPQLLLYTSTWTQKVAELNDAYVQEPLSVVCSKLEMAVSMKCSLFPHVCTTEQRFSELRRLVDTIVERQYGDRIVVCTSSAQDATRIKEIFIRYSHTVLCAHENLVQDQTAAVFSQWRAPCAKDSVPILVITDAVLLKMCIDDAQCVIHFDFPASSKTAFGNRLDCLRKAFMSGETSTCSSHLFITEEALEAAHTILHLLKRFGSAIPEELIEQGKAAVQLREEKRRGQPLCENLKQWGRCRQFNEGKGSCPSRHVVVEDIDRPVTLPASGYVKIMVMNVVNASHYWARIISHRPLGGDDQSLVQNRLHLRLTMDLAMYYGDPSNLVLKDDTKVGDVCAVKNAHNAYARARVLEVSCRGARPVGQVLLLDEGRVVAVSLAGVMELPEHLAKIPQQAIEVFACRLKPCDEEVKWTPQANEMAKSILNRTLNGKIVLAMKGCLWLDPLIEQQMLCNLRVLETTLNIRYELQHKKLGCSNPTHLDALLEMMSAWAPPKSTATSADLDEVAVVKHLDNMGLPIDSFVEVVVSHTVNPDIFFLQVNKEIEQLDEMQGWIHHSGLNPEHQPITPECLFIGTYVLSLSIEDECWYRARIDGRQNDNFCVQYVDFGNKEWRKAEHLRLLPRDPQMELPTQAICCTLADISPGDYWSMEAAEEFVALTENRVLLAKAKGVLEEEDGSDRTYYRVELYDPSTGQDVLVAGELASAGHGKLSPSALSFLIPDGVTVADYVQKLGENAFSKLPDLCRAVLHYKDDVTQQELTLAIRSLLWNNKPLHGGFIQTAGVSSLCRSMEVVQSDVSREHVVASLTSIAESSPEDCSSIVSHGGVKQICQYMRPLASSSLVETCCSALKCLSDISQEMRDTVRDSGGVRALCRILPAASQDTKVVAAVVAAMLAFASGSTRNCEVLRNEGAVQAACFVFSQDSSSRSFEHVSHLLEVIANLCPRALPSFRASGAILQVSNILLQCHNDKSLNQFMRSLQVMIADDVDNIEYASSIDVHGKLGQVLSRRCGMITRGLAMELQRRIPAMCHSTTGGTVPSQVSCRSSCEPVSGDDRVLDLAACADSNNVRRPKIVWAQRRGFLKLCLRVADIEKRFLSVNLRQFSFGTVVVNQAYHVDLTFFGDVLHTGVREKFTGSAYSVILTKKEPCFWPRLLQSKVKMPFITLDFDNYDDSDEEQERLEHQALRRQRAQRQQLLRVSEAGPDMDESEEEDDSGDSDDDFFDGYAPF